jgi:hypothetical protein
MQQFLAALALLLCSASGASATTLEFSPQRKEYQAAAQEYAAIWAADGARIVSLLAQATRVTLPAGNIEVIVFEDVSHSGRPGGPMYLRASYPYAVKQATVVHELAHRYVDRLDLKNPCFGDVHELLSLVLSDVWGKLWGSRFVAEQSAVEAARSERYRRAWAGVLDMTPDARGQRLQALLRPSCTATPWQTPTGDDFIPDVVPPDANADRRGVEISARGHGGQSIRSGFPDTSPAPSLRTMSVRLSPVPPTRARAVPAA